MKPIRPIVDHASTPLIATRDIITNSAAMIVVPSPTPSRMLVRDATLCDMRRREPDHHEAADVDDAGVQQRRHRRRRLHHR